MFRRTLFSACSAALSAAVIASAAQADIHVAFIEGAPKDRFVVTNTAACALKAAQVTIDLAGSDAGLIFDVTASGSGVEVFQPFDVVAGAEHLVSLPVVRDGDQTVMLDLSNLGQNQSVAFTIDVDDTAGGREITVSQSEIRGAIVSARLGDQLFTSAFDTSSKAHLATGDCLS